MFVSIGSRAGRNRRRWGVRPVYDGNGSLVIPSLDILGSHHIWDAAGASRMTFDVGGNVQGGQQMNGSILFGPTNNGYRLGMVCHNGGIGFQGFAATTNDGGLKGQRWAYGTDFAYINSSALNFPSAPYYISWSSDTYLGRRGIATLQLGLADAAAPVAQTLSVQSVVAGTTNTAGANFTIQASYGTGNQPSGDIILKTNNAGSSGTGQNNATYTNALRIANFSSSPGTVGEVMVANGNVYAGSLILRGDINGGNSLNGSIYLGGSRLVYGGVTTPKQLSFDHFDGTTAFLTLGGSYSASRPGLKVNGSSLLAFRLSDDSGDAPISAASLTFTDGTVLASAGRKLLTTITPTAVASIAYTSIPSGYSKFEIEFDNVTNANGGANEAPLIALSADNGTTYDSAQCGAANTGLSGAMYGVVNIHAVGLTSTNKVASGSATQGTVYWAIAGKWTSQTGATNAIRFAWSGGSNFVAQGKIRIYGIV